MQQNISSDFFSSRHENGHKTIRTDRNDVYHLAAADVITYLKVIYLRFISLLIAILVCNTVVSQGASWKRQWHSPLLTAFDFG